MADSDVSEIPGKPEGAEGDQQSPDRPPTAPVLGAAIADDNYPQESQSQREHDQRPASGPAPSRGRRLVRWFGSIKDVDPRWMQVLMAFASVVVAITAIVYTTDQATLTRKLNQEQTMESLRAWVIMKELSFTNESPPTMQYVYGNFGKSPAIGVRVYVHTQPVGKKIGTPVPGANVGILGPGAENFATGDLRRFDPNIHEFIGYGRIEYRDIFGRRQYTDFCTEFDLRTMRTMGSKWCPEGNAVGAFDKDGKPQPSGTPTTK